MAESIKSRTAVIADTLQRSDLSNDLSQELDQSKSDTSVLTGRLSQLKKLVNRYAWILSATISLLACGVLAYLTRVKTLAAKAELAKQQAIVAEEKKKVAELQVKVERLKRAQSLGTMAGSVAHDFNNLLFGVSGNAELIEMSLEKGTLDADFGHARIAAILDASNRAQSLARQMLDFAGKRCLNLVDIDLNEFLRKEKGIIESTSQNHLFEFELSETPVKVSADDTQLAQTILNFATNAVEASAPGSKITFRTFFDDIESVENRTNLFGTRNLGGRFAVLEITDQGVGIKPGTIGQIFEPYFSTKNTSGRGLGLAVVYGMAESLEGFIRCYSTPGVGTKFQLLLPVLSGTSPNAIVDDQVSPADSHTPDEFKRKHANKRVLIVDDELSVSETCRQLLSQLGLNYESVYNGVDAIERLSASNGQSDFDAILLDVVMPSLNGDEVLQQLKDLKIEIPVVVMSGFSPERLDKFLNVPLVSAALPKPFSFHELANALSVALGRPADVVTRTTERLDASHELKSPNTDVSKSTSATERKP